MSKPPLPPPPPLPPRLTWVPSLDGLRGLAVLAVVAFHAGHLDGGYLGVDLFFTVSGFLITRLILDDLGRGHFSLSKFWGRRARRLLPAMWLLLAVLILVSPWLIDRSAGVSLRRSVVATAIYIANWWQLSGPGSYWEAFGTPAPLNHTWSLAIEEQFYLLWPVIALVIWRVAKRPARALLIFAGVAIAGSVAAQYLLFEPGTDGARAYLGTDTRVASILIGCAAAVILWTRSHRAKPVVWHWLHLLAPVALACIFIAWFVGKPGAWLYQGGFPLLAIGAAIILASSAAPTSSRLNRALAWAPLVLIGQVSYGIYLWHWPVFTLLGPDELKVRGWQLLVARLLVTAVLVTISYVLIERPYRFRRGPIHLRFLGAAVCVIGVIAAVLVWPPTPKVSAAKADTALQALTGQASTSVAPSAGANTDTTQGIPPPPPGTAAPRTATADASAGDLDTSAKPSTSTTAVDPSTSTTAATAPPTTVVFPAPKRLLVVGDSVAFTLKRGFRHQVPAGMEVEDDGVVACSPGTPEYPQIRFYDGREITDPCVDAIEKWPASVQRDGMDGVLMVFGASGLDRQINGEWRRPCDAEYDTWFEAAVATQMRAIQSSGARIWIALAPYNRHASVGTPELQAQADRQTDCLNRIYQSAATTVGGVAVIDLRSLICPSAAACATEIEGITLRPDGLHFEGEGAEVVARWLLMQLGPAST